MSMTLLITADDAQLRERYQQLLEPHLEENAMNVVSSELSNALNDITRYSPQHTMIIYDESHEQAEQALSELINQISNKQDITLIVEQDNEKIVSLAQAYGIHRCISSSELNADYLNALLSEICFGQQAAQVPDDEINTHNEEYLRKLLSLSLIRNKRHQRNVGLLLLTFDKIGTGKEIHSSSAATDVMRELYYRLTDIIRSGDHVVRIGEFSYGVVVEELDSLLSCGQIAERICHALQRPFIIASQNVILKPYIGISGNTEFSIDAKQMINEAKCVQQEKYLRRDAGYAFFDKKLASQDDRRHRLRTDLTRLLERNDFFLLYHPVYHLDKKNIHIIDALLRWDHPELDIVSPTEFIPVVESLGLLPLITLWIINCILQDTAQWNVEPKTKTNFMVKLTPRVLLTESFCKKAAPMIEQLKQQNIHITFSVRQKSLQADNNQAQEVYKAVETLGCSLCIEDLGLDDANLSALFHPSISTVKLNMNMGRRILAHDTDKKMAQAIVAMSHALSIDSVATGIENRMQLEEFSSMSYQYGQGYYFCKPLKAKEMMNLIKQKQGQSDEQDNKQQG